MFTIRTEPAAHGQASCQVGCNAVVPGAAAVGSSVSFAATATATGCASAVSYEWNFGDGTPLAAGANVSHSFTAPGIYNWNLTARADNGLTAIETIAGGYGEGVQVKQSSLTTPIAIARDPLGRGLYVFDQTATTGLLRFINTGLSTVTLLGKTIEAGTSRVLLDGQTSIGAINALAARADGNVLYVGGDALFALNVSASPQTVFGQTLAAGQELALTGTFGALRNLNGIAVHPQTGEVYASTRNLVIKPTAVDQSIVVAGNGAPTSSREEFPSVPTPALNVPLLNLRDLAFDNTGNLFLCDSGHKRVVKLDANGLLSLTVQFDILSYNYYSAGLAVINNSVYLADGNDQTILRLTGTGVTSPILIAGTPGTGCNYNYSDNCGDGGIIANAYFALAETSSPNPFLGLESDSNGLLVLDQSNEKRGRIRYLNLSAQPVTLAGTTIAANRIETIAGDGLKSPYDGALATASTLSDLSGVTVDANGNLWLADTYRHSIRFVNRGSSAVTLFAGTAAEQTVLPGRISTINRNVPPNAVDNVTVNLAGFNTPQGLFANAQGIFVVDAKGGPPIPGSAANQRTGTVRFINTSPTTVTFFNGSALPISVPPGFIRAIAGGGTSSGIGNGGFALNARLVAPTDVAVNPATGDIFIADVGNSAVRKINGSTGVVSSLSLAASSYTGIGMDVGGRLYLADFGPTTFGSPGGRVLRETAAGSGVFAQMNTTAVIAPRDVAIDAAGNAYVIQSDFRSFTGNPKRILKIAANGNVTTIAGSDFGFDGDGGAALSAKLALAPPDIYSQAIPVPVAKAATANIVLGANGEIIFADSMNRRIRRIGEVPTTCSKSGTITITGNYPLPTISQLSPNSAFIAQPFTLTITGTGFTPASVTRMGVSPLTTNFVSNTQLSVPITSEFLTVAGSAPVSVVNPSPGGGQSNSLPLAINGDITPSLSELIPNTVARGGPGFRLQLVGRNFQPGSVVRTNNQNRTTIFVNSTTLQVDIDASEIQLAGLLYVVVFTSSAGIQTTNSMLLQIVCTPATILPDSLPIAGIGAPYSQTVTVQGINQPVFETGTVATGLTISSSGVISGTPSTACTFTFTVRITGQFNCQAEKTYSLAVACPPTQLLPPTPTLPQATSGLPYNQTFTLNGTSSPATFSVTSGALPTGLMLSPNGNLSGTPTAAGNFSFSIRALITGGCVSESQYSLIVVSPPITITPIIFPNAVKDIFYYGGISVSGGTAPYRVSISGPGVPGLGIFEPAPGFPVIMGIPTAGGVFNIVLRVTDATGYSADKQVTLNVEEFTTRLIAPPTCIGEGAIITVEASIPGLAIVSQSPLLFFSNPKSNLVLVPNSCTSATGNCTVDTSSNTVTWTGNIPPGQNAKIRYQVQVINGVVPGTDICVDSSASYGGLIPSPGTTAVSTVCTRINCPAPGPGAALSESETLSGQRSGSVLIYNIYTSGSTSGNTQNTRLSLTNTHPALPAKVHLFFVDGASCSVADSYVCLTPNQTTSFLASDFDPGTTGYVVAVAVDANGCPINFNHLIGDEYVKFSSGHAANLGAEAFSALTGGLPACDGSSVTATLNFDGVGYSRLPRVLALSSVGSRADGNDTMLIVNRIGGNLGTGASTLGSLFGIFYNDTENALSFSVTGSCQLRASLTNNFPRIAPRFEQFIPAGRTGWLRLYSQSPNDIGITGAAINFNANAGISAGAFNQGHNLHALTLSATNSFTIPVFPPSC